MSQSLDNVNQSLQDLKSKVETMALIATGFNVANGIAIRFVRSV
jgi:hypothetical protein